VPAADNSDNDTRAARSGGSSYFLSGGGEMGAIMRAYDWSQSALGLPEKWPQSLRTVVRLMLNTGHPMYVWWGEGLACLYNDAYAASIGSERHPGSLGKPAREVWDEIWPIIGPQIEQVMSGRGATWHVNALVPITRHGRREDVYWTYSYSPIDDDTAPNGIGGVLVVCTETTQQVLASRRIATERDRLAQLFEQAPTFMAMLRGPEHRFELANPSYMQLIGHRPLLGRTLAEAMPDAVAQGYLVLLDDVYRSGKAYSATSAKFEIQALPGGPTVERFVDFVYQPIKDQLGEVTGIFVVGADVTDRARADAALRESEFRLRETAEKLRAADAAKDEFLATLAHELRNPLAPMRNAVELLGLAPQNAEVISTVRAIMGRQIAQMVRLIDDLLDLSRVSRGLVELRRSPVQLAKIMTEAVETSRPFIEGFGHTLEVAVPASDLVLDADHARLVQVFTNLLNNAAKFTPRAGKIDFSVPEILLDSVTVSVRDNGIGIPPEMLGDVFNMFTQVDRSHAQLGGGLGIGLTLVRRLVEMHGGSVAAESGGAGKGSTFLVSLPVLPRKREDRHAGADAPITVSPVRARKILVADDNVDAASSLALMLNLDGHDTRVAHDGEEAFAIASRFLPEVMILDIAMPRMDGLQLARRVRAEPWGGAVLLIAASGWAQADHRSQSQASGFDHHLVKPLDPTALSELLRNSQ